MDTLPVIFTTDIKEEWLDYNNHMNVAYYVLVFDMAGEALAASLGLGEQVTAASGFTWVVLESHITYDNEVSLGQEVEVRVQLVDCDHKRMHLYFEMYVTGEDGYLAATTEQMALCMNLNTRRSDEFPDTVKEALKSMTERQGDLERPGKLGRVIGIRR